MGQQTKEKMIFLFGLEQVGYSSVNVVHGLRQITRVLFLQSLKQDGAAEREVVERDVPDPTFLDIPFQRLNGPLFHLLVFPLVEQKITV